MGKEILVNLCKNKSNGQINICLPKKQLGKRNLRKILDARQLKITLGEFY